VVWDVMVYLHFYFCAHYLYVYREGNRAHEFCAAFLTRKLQMLSPGSLTYHRLTELGTATMKVVTVFLAKTQHGVILQYSC